MHTETRDSIKKGSKSFFFASLFFSGETKGAAWRLYRWCRYVDDEVDSAPDLASARANLDRLTKATELAYVSRPTDGNFLALHEIAKKYGIPAIYPQELIKGMEMDVVGYEYQTVEDLRLYSYRVAGVVGLMMCHIMGVSHPRALSHAVDLGIAMQLTNIARDVAEDYDLGRVYLPAEWLDEQGLTRSNLLDSSHAPLVHDLRLQLLDEADKYYRSGLKGLRYLPLRAALAVSIAGLVYRHIGFKIRRSAAHEIRVRAITRFHEKLNLAVLGTLGVLGLVPSRLLNPWRRSDTLPVLGSHR